MRNQINALDWFSRLRFIADRVPNALRRPARWLWHSWLERRVLGADLPPKNVEHGLPGELIVSLTSYPARFGTLHLTLRALLAQSIRPDRLILWIAENDICLLPPAVLELKRFGLDIRACEDLRSYKKLIPALQGFPDSYIVTADDDLFYPSNWLEILVNGFEIENTAIICRRAIRPVRLSSGRLAPFNDWQWDVSDEEARVPSRTILLESGAGALFPPGSLHPLITNREMFRRLSPEADDLWINACARLAGTPIKKVGDSLWIMSWRGSQTSSLWVHNKTGGNDKAIGSLENELGISFFEPDHALSRA